MPALNVFGQIFCCCCFQLLLSAAYCCWCCCIECCCCCYCCLCSLAAAVDGIIMCPTKRKRKESVRCPLFHLPQLFNAHNAPLHSLHPSLHSLYTPLHPPARLCTPWAITSAICCAHLYLLAKQKAKHAKYSITLWPGRERGEEGRPRGGNINQLPFISASIHTHIYFYVCVCQGWPAVSQS